MALLRSREYRLFAALTLVWISRFAMACAAPPGAVSGEEQEPAASAPVASPTSPTLTIGIYNVLYALAEPKPDADPSTWADAETRTQALSLDVDILLLQETNAAWEAALRPALAARFPTCVFHSPRRWAPEGLAACSKYPISEDELVAAPEAMFPAQKLRVSAPRGPVDLFNVHLQPAIAGPESWMDEHRRTRPQRAREVAFFLSRLPASGAAIVAGDFNERVEGDLFGALDSSGFDNALPKAGERAVTWRWAGVSPPLEHQLDHLAYRRSAFDIVSARVVRGGRSDHDAVIVTLRFRS